MIELTPQISLIELLYFLGGVAGLVYAWRWTRRAESDKAGLLKLGLNGGRLLAARINLAIGWCMMAKLAIYTTAGFLTMTLPPASNSGDITWQSSLLGLGFILAEYLAVWLLRYINSMYDEMARFFDTAARNAAAQRRRPSEGGA